jgi:hypothetical protein
VPDFQSPPGSEPPTRLIVAVVAAVAVVSLILALLLIAWYRRFD